MLSIKDLIKKNLTLLDEASRLEETSDMAVVYKDVICSFYEDNPTCEGCIATMDDLTTCIDDYKSKIAIRPMEKWSKEFDALEERQPVATASLNTMVCGNCYFSTNCPEYKQQARCSILWTTPMEDLSPKEQIGKIIKIQEQRVNIARAAELMDGGIPDQNLSNELDRLSGLIQTQQNIGEDRLSINVQASGNAAGGGILAQLFGVKKELPAEKPLEISESTVVSTLEKMPRSDRKSKMKRE